MNLEGWAAAGALALSLLVGIFALAGTFGVNRHRLDRLEREVHDHLKDAPDVRSDMTLIKYVLGLIAKKLGIDMPDFEN